MLDGEQTNQLCINAARDGVTRLVVGAVIAIDQSVLLLQRAASDFMGGIFELPSGKVDPGETLADALRREVREETGLDVIDIGQYLGSFDYISGSGKKTRQFTFVVKVSRPHCIHLSEHDGYQWASIRGHLPVTEAVSAVIDTYRSLAE